MKVRVQLKPNSKVEGVRRLSGTEYEVRVNAPPVEGKANSRAIDLLSQFFDVPKTKVILIKGAKSRKKTFEIRS